MDSLSTLARAAAKSGVTQEAIVAEIESIAGFTEPLREILKIHFFRRGHILRCFRILADARQS